MGQSRKMKISVAVATTMNSLFLPRKAALVSLGRHMTVFIFPTSPLGKCLVQISAACFTARWPLSKFVRMPWRPTQSDKNPRRKHLRPAIFDLPTTRVCFTTPTCYPRITIRPFKKASCHHQVVTIRHTNEWSQCSGQPTKISPTNQLTNQPTTQPINQPINHPTNQTHLLLNQLDPFLQAPELMKHSKDPGSS